MMQIPLALSKCDLDEERQTMMKDRRLRRVSLLKGTEDVGPGRVRGFSTGFDGEVLNGVDLLNVFWTNI